MKRLNEINDWQEMIGQVMCCDALELMKRLPDKSVDLVLTDPPYGMEFVSGHRTVKHDAIIGDDRFPVEIMQEFFRIAKRGVYVFSRWDNLRELPEPKSVLAWVKNNWSMGDLEHEHGRQWEAISFYPQEKHEFIKRIPDVVNANRTGNNLHPTEKPIRLLRQLMSANVGDLILDPFMGSFTTAIAAEDLGRQWIGCDLSEKYCEIGERRINDFRSQPKLL